MRVAVLLVVLSFSGCDVLRLYPPAPAGSTQAAPAYYPAPVYYPAPASAPPPEVALPNPAPQWKPQTTCVRQGAFINCF